MFSFSNYLDFFITISGNTISLGFSFVFLFEVGSALQSVHSKRPAIPKALGNDFALPHLLLKKRKVLKVSDFKTKLIQIIEIYLFFKKSNRKKSGDF